MSERLKKKAVKGNTKKPPKRKPRKTKQPIQYKRWCFTWNNYDSHDLHFLIIELESQKLNYIIGEETGECGTPHLQGYIECPKKVRWSEFGLGNHIHWEPAKGNREQNIEYCSKEGYYHCVPSLCPITVINTLYPWQRTIADLYSTIPDGRTCHWIVDIEGGKGKSSFCKYMYVKHKVLTIQGGKLADIMNIVFNVDMRATRMVLIDIPRSTGNRVSYSAIECILNGMITNTKYETGVKVFDPPHLVVFSNFYPNMKELSSDRWKIMEL